ncbi:hypothetical protein [Mangrovivirga cuniculi]|uniref:Uncharacterized protein n=1 Tax=Mangrovivirga cuniculi TaxID=2715131 RepID=A0A4D7JLD8_9BACT|nr:hypothetical protein [Mangrovivirga cuniculi]QCK15713.1 hypothetical protein DCC35_13650 [Mangrovivirga cuniculi]
MKKTASLLVIGFLFVSCSHKECCTIVDTEVLIMYLNDSGENLFEIEDGYTESNVRVYYNIDGSWKREYQGGGMVEYEDGTYLSVSPSLYILEDGYSETKIEFSNSEIDIMRTKISDGHNTYVTEVYYNGEFKWESGTFRSFEVVK